MEISIPTFVIQIINFSLFALVLIVFLLKPLQKVIDERRRKIENDFEEAKEAVMIFYWEEHFKRTFNIYA